jgi:hypothetical protein
MLSGSNAQGTSFSASAPIPGTPVQGSVGITTDVNHHVVLVWSNQGVFIAQGSAASDFSISAASASLNLLPGGSESTQITVTSTGGFNQTVVLSCGKLPPGATCSFAPSSIMPSASGARATPTMSLAPTFSSGNFTFTISGAAGNTTHTQNMQVTVGGMTGSITPMATTIAVGGTSNFTVTANSTGGFSGQVNLACSGAPGGVSCIFNPPQLNVSANGGVSSLLTVQVAVKPVSALAPGDPPAMFRATQEFVPMAQYFVAISSLPLLLLTIALAVSRGAKGVRKNLAPFGWALGAMALTIALAATMTSCGGGVTTASLGTNTSATGSTGSTGSSGSGTTGGTMGSGGGTGGSTSITFPITVQAQSGSAIVNLGAITITVP